jgi:hypothetical protein
LEFVHVEWMSSNLEIFGPLLLLGVGVLWILARVLVA